VDASVDDVSERVCFRKKDADGGNQSLQNGKLNITKLCSHINKKRGWKNLCKNQNPLIVQATFTNVL
jgi:hypothetical protein